MGPPYSPDAAPMDCAFFDVYAQRQPVDVQGRPLDRHHGRLIQLGLDLHQVAVGTDRRQGCRRSKIVDLVLALKDSKYKLNWLGLVEIIDHGRARGKVVQYSDTVYRPKMGRYRILSRLVFGNISLSVLSSKSVLSSTWYVVVVLSLFVVAMIISLNKNLTLLSTQTAAPQVKKLGP